MPLLTPFAVLPQWADVPPGPPPAPVGGAAPRPLLENTDFLVACGLMALLLFGGAYVLSYFDRRRKRQEAAAADSASLMETYRELYENGELTEAEYQKVRARVAGKMKLEVGLGGSAGLPGVPPKPPVPHASRPPRESDDPAP